MSQGAEPNSRDEEMEHPPSVDTVTACVLPDFFPDTCPSLPNSFKQTGISFAPHESRNPHVSVLEARIRKWMPIGEAAVSAYEQQVQKMERDLLLAKMKLGWAKVIVTGTESALHPISRVPLEIWIHIFTWAYGHETEWPVVSLTDLSQVCRHWRQMLTNSAAASLWNPLHLGAGDSLDKKSKKLQYIAASGIVDVIMPTERSQLNEKLLVTIFRQPLQDAPIPRIRNLALHDFYSPSGYLARSFFHQTAPLPDIANLYVVGPPWNTGRYPFHTRKGISKPEIHIESEMQSLTLIQTFEPDRRLHISWSSLTVYRELNTARADGMLPASHLQRLSSLTKLSLGGVFLPIVPWKWISGSTTFQGIDCPNLTELHLSGSSDRTLHVTEASHRFPPGPRRIPSPLPAPPDFGNFPSGPLLLIRPAFPPPILSLSPSTGSRYLSHRFLSFIPKAQERRWRAERTIQEWEPEFSSKWTILLVMPRALNGVYPMQRD
ncbi:hypothetical protein R3P38DRAFT_2801775 [Favolaschia claudopus]|uniref:F-box domain-containing protein n=1 Tax=Favolaschia claudopus TaxID=2862362 RepID=A0AAV9ZW90_9AGAR